MAGNPLAFTDPTGYCPVCIGMVNPPAAKPSTIQQLVGSVFRIAAAAICVMGGQPARPSRPWWR